MAPLLSYVRLLSTKSGAPPLKTLKVDIANGESIEGTVLHEGLDDLQLRTADGRVKLLRRAGDRYRAVMSQNDWTTYDGQHSGNRYSELRQIDKGNVAKLAPKWIFTMPGTSPLEGMP